MIEGKKVTARNYAAQAEAAIRELLKEYPPGKSVDGKSLLWLADRISSAVHFASPDNGSIFSDELRGLDGVDLALPYPRMTLEYFVDRNEELLTGLASEYSPKRLIYLEQISRDELEDGRRDGISQLKYLAKGEVATGETRLAGDEFIMMSCVCVIRGKWSPVPWSFVFQCQNWRDPNPRNLVIVGEKGFLLPEYAASLLDKYPTKTLMDMIGLDLGPEIHAVLEFIEAMSCTNIVEKVHEAGAAPTVNKHRLARGKVPLHETKTLTIDPTWLEKYKRRAAQSQSGRASPKFHFRRSHTRVINRGKENQYAVRIPKLAIGDPSRGTVTKGYRIVKKDR